MGEVRREGGTPSRSGEQKKERGGEVERGRREGGGGVTPKKTD